MESSPQRWLKYTYESKQKKKEIAGLENYVSKSTRVHVKDQREIQRMGQLRGKLYFQSGIPRLAIIDNGPLL